eukprot:Blabericola_migrator_1__9040@NODE_480_length_8144_cov_370_014362_g305_i1_p4_GENE_NODE_480_length_8144_cov_370_014362_g305_i1NODE_480_length_8144_cov_370_014362_g305_i1_p4_ORF_typecomplete_len268_score22_01_NODE_480_length_8144_cov_370_014362_g305_i149525755
MIRHSSSYQECTLEKQILVSCSRNVVRDRWLPENNTLSRYLSYTHRPTRLDQRAGPTDRAPKMHSTLSKARANNSCCFPFHAHIQPLPIAASESLEHNSAFVCLCLFCVLSGMPVLPYDSSPPDAFPPLPPPIAFPDLAPPMDDFIIPPVYDPYYGLQDFQREMLKALLQADRMAPPRSQAWLSNKAPVPNVTPPQEPIDFRASRLWIFISLLVIVLIIYRLRGSRKANKSTSFLSLLSGNTCSKAPLTIPSDCDQITGLVDLGTFA